MQDSICKALRPQVRYINAKDPLTTSAVSYNSGCWDKLNPDAQKAVEAFADKDISRADIVNAFEQYYAGETNVLFPFTLCMIWGFGKTGYGTYRTNTYLATKKNQDLIANALKQLKKGNREAAFKALCSINGLSVSYVSKVLYFATRALGQEDYALIFDIRVARNLVKLTAPALVDILEIRPKAAYPSYQKYNELIHNLAKEMDVTAEALEMYLFDGNFEIGQ